MNADAQRSLGLDLGGTSLKWVVWAAEQIEDAGAVPTPHGRPATVVEAMAGIAERAGNVDTIGVGVPGLHEPDGATTLLPNVPGDWSGFPLGRQLGTRTGRPVVVCNDARAFTLAESRVGAGRGCRDLVAVTLGTGVGGGVLANGRVHLGVRNRAGELGHQAVVPEGERCGCGGRGCVETVASGPAIVAAAARVVWQGLDSALGDACGGDPSQLEPSTVAEVARAGDPFARDVIERAGRALGHGLANACTILAPERIIVGGGVVAAIDVLRPVLAEAIAARARLPDAPAIRAAELGWEAGAVGAALWGREAEEERG